LHLFKLVKDIWLAFKVQQFKLCSSMFLVKKHSTTDNLFFDQMNNMLF